MTRAHPAGRAQPLPGMLLACGLFATTAWPAGQQIAPVPAFPAQAEVVTVDAVVLGPDGRLVGDLTAADFVLREDGRPQALVGFEVGQRTPAGEEPRSGSEEAEVRQQANAHGRTVAFVVDDLGIRPSSMPATVRAISEWLVRSADARDSVTLATSRERLT